MARGPTFDQSRSGPSGRRVGRGMAARERVGRGNRCRAGRKDGGGWALGERMGSAPRCVVSLLARGEPPPWIGDARLACSPLSYAVATREAECWSSPLEKARETCCFRRKHPWYTCSLAALMVPAERNDAATQYSRPLDNSSRAHLQHARPSVGARHWRKSATPVAFVANILGTLVHWLHP